MNSNSEEIQTEVGTMSSAPDEAACTHAERSTREKKTAVNGPIFFLIREQAKSVVAIKELQARMTVLEDIQERLMLAIQNVQHHLVATVESTSDSVSKSAAKDHVHLLGLPKFPERTVPARDDLLINANSNSSITSKDVAKDSKTLNNAIPSCSSKCDSKGDSYNKDSGVDSDYREQESDCSLPTCATGGCSRSSQSEDELLQLLDMIDQKSLLLLQQVEGIEKQKRSVQDMEDESKNGKSVSLDNLLAENMDTQRQLCEVKADRDDLRDRLAKLEFATDAVLSEKMKLQKTLDAMIFENRKLQEKIKECQDQEKPKDELNAQKQISMTTFKRDAMSESVLEKASIKRKYLQYSEKSRRKVSAVLKETNVIELQRQLLTYIMENDVLQAKLQQDHPTRLFHWMKVEARLKQELKRTLHDKEDLLQKLEKSKSEIADLCCRVKELEEALMDEQQDKCVKNFGLGSTEDWRDTTRYKGGNANVASPYSPLGFGDFSKTQSLPAMMHLDSDGQRVTHQQHSINYGQTYDTGNFTDVSLNGSTTPNTLMNSCQNSNVQKDLLDLNDNDDNCHSSLLSNSTYWNNPTLPAGISSATSSLCCQIHSKDHASRQRWDYMHREQQHSAKFLTTSDVYWNREPKSDLDSICSEFDPLSEGASCENYVDSLNLSIPLKPTPVVSQLSSMGDSLHSASLDLGCASSALWNRTQKLPNARSVDGIRQFLVDNRNQSFYKDRTSSSSSRCGQNSQTSNKVNRPLPVNFMDCVRGTPDYTLL